MQASPATHWNGKLGLPDFAAIKDEELADVFDAAFAAHAAEIEAIADNSEPATIENTLKAMELGGEALDRVSSIFGAKAGANTNDVIQALERDLAPKMSRHFASITMNKKLFARINALWEKREKFDAETARVLDQSRAGFVRAGALLNDEDQTRFKQIDERLAELSTNFGQNVLKDESDWVMFVSPADLESLPDFLVSSMKSAATERGKPEAWALTLSRSIVEPFLSLSPRRDLREVLFNAFIKRGENGGDSDNTAIIAEMLALRSEKAKLLGFATFADFKLDKTMAAKPANVYQLLNPVWEAARKKAGIDQKALGELAQQTGANADIQPWDWRYYAEKLRAKTYAFDEAELKPYLQLDNMIAAAFDVAQRLFGLTFEEQNGLTAWHEDSRVWRVFGQNDQGDKQQIGVFIGDYFARSSKQSGAWMSELQGQHGLDSGRQPIIYNVCNFAKPAEGEPALLSFDDARTLFHEFGHAMHGMLSNVTWPSVSGTNVYRDFVELPSQLYEHWLSVPEVLAKYAIHAETSEPMPKALMEKLKAARTFDSAFNAVEFTASALTDMAYHSRPEVPADPMAFEKEELARIQMPDAIAMRHRSTHFGHIFSGGYSAGYYSYLWSEVLDADAFAAFEETGDPFNAELSKKLKDNIYAAGGTKDPTVLYAAFRGNMPNADAMMKKRGLA
jgi:peptidyl-dipeptidase Dcp